MGGFTFVDIKDVDDETIAKWVSDSINKDGCVPIEDDPLLTMLAEPLRTHLGPEPLSDINMSQNGSDGTIKMTTFSTDFDIENAQRTDIVEMIDQPECVPNPLQSASTPFDGPIMVSSNYANIDKVRARITLDMVFEKPSNGPALTPLLNWNEKNLVVTTSSGVIKSVENVDLVETQHIETANIHPLRHNKEIGDYAIDGHQGGRSNRVDENFNKKCQNPDFFMDDEDIIETIKKLGDSQKQNNVCIKGYGYF